MPIINSIPKEAPRVDETIMSAGKYEITSDARFTIDIYLKKIDDRWVVVNKSKDKDVVKEQVTFRPWSFEEMIEIRKRANTYDAIKRMYWIDVDLMNRLKVQKLLQSWTFDRENPRLKLHQINGVMTDESWLAFSRLQVNVSRHIIDKLNEILEYQQ